MNSRRFCAIGCCACFAADRARTLRKCENMLTKTTLFTILCASTIAMAPTLSGCFDFGGCGVYDGDGNHIDMEEGGSAGESGSGGTGGTGGSGGSAGSDDAGP